jgi:hypothetical protein
MAGSISIVITLSTRGLPSSSWPDIPDPLPITPARRASGLCASVRSGPSIWVDSSEPVIRRTATESPSARSIQRCGRDASGFPLVLIEITPFWKRCTATVEVAASW